MRIAQREVVDRLVAERGVVRAGTDLGVAALLYTYRCTIACRHCCFGCGLRAPDIHMDTGRAVAYLAALHETGRVVHVAGGECMLYWDDLAEVLERSARQGIQPHFIETNCSFAADEAIVRERLGVLRACGVAGIFLSADPFHQAFVPPERFLRVRRIACEVFGTPNVWAPMAPQTEIEDLACIARDERRLAEYVRANPPTLVGAAQRELARFFPDHPLDALPPGTNRRDCAIVFDRARIWEFHIDPYDNIQTNCGVILGKATDITPVDLLRRGPGEANQIVRILCRTGPAGLAEMARQRHGYAPPPAAKTKCDLCYTVRKFLRPFYPDILGPDEVYAA